ncbi:magnesium-translocating P-type ATPase [Accumulibacter sp.]|uniref:magnesium-translocating P-type ATPase n=1 Tax=Accumulibacter sp. TaxID=2053492 RepID=UPI00258CB858|nr:magnesium-translocating P-type ATPase [Accumulibacter sp.]
MDFLSFGGKLAGSRESQAMKDANLQSASARSAGGEAVCRPAFWSAGAHAAAQALGTGSDGLTSAQAEQQLARCGPNVLRGKSEPALIVEFLARFRNPLVLVLLAASGISALTGEEASFLIVVASVTLDFFQEYRAGQAAERLSESVTVRAKVLRNGRETSIAATTVVPGDVIVVAAGDLVPADSVLIEAKDLFVNQSLLTGESFPAEKRAQTPTGASTDPSCASNALFMGTSIISGTGKALVCRTGRSSELGEIGEALGRRAPPTAFEHGTRQFCMLIMRLTVLLVLFVLLVNTLLHRPLLESFLFAIALAVGLTPELLPMIVSVTLSRGALRMAQHEVIVKHLPAIHNLGSMDVLCTDKTGTLTEARIRLERHVNVAGQDSVEVLHLAFLNSFFETGLRSPLDAAILEHQEIDVSAWRKIDEVPFDFECRRVSVLVDDGQHRRLVVKGAPEDILGLSTHCADDSGQLQCLDEQTLARAMAVHDLLAADGFRVLGIAWRDVATEHIHARIDDETELTLAGFAAFLDPPKAGAAAALAALQASGVSVKVVTGDNELVTRHVCAELGLAISGVLLGSEIENLDDPALLARVERVNAFCRVTPAQKNRVILALKAGGHTVGYLGDGVNDAPSLHSADVGISVDSAVDVAKAAAEMILLRHDLGVLHEGVIEGRRTFGNIMKYIMMGTSSNFGNMFSMAGATLFLPFLPMLPVQVLLNNLLYDISEVPIPLDRVDDDYLAQPRHWDMNFIRNFMLAIGPVSSLFDFLTFAALIVLFQAGEGLFRTGWFIESIATQVLVIFVIRTRGAALHSRPNPMLALASLAVVALAFVLPFTPAAAHLGFVAPPPQFFVFVALMTALYLCAVEIVKRAFYRRFGHGPTAS